MGIEAFARRVARRLRSAASHERAGIAAYRSRRLREARREFVRALRRRGTRRTWLYAASTYDRLKRPELRDSSIAMAEQLHPSGLYDARAAFAVAKVRPQERDEVAIWMASHRAELRADAERLRGARTRVGEPRYAFVYWNSRDRPDVVQHCVDAMRKHLPDGLTLIELDETTLGDWVTIDRRILDRVDIPAHGADIIRLHLLSTYGGLWLDASCLLNPSFPEWFARVRQEDFFLFTYRGSRTGNWFIWARPDSYRLQLIRSAMDAWFIAGRPWTNYFQMHDMVEMLYWTDDRYRAEWDAGLHLRPARAFDCHRALGRSVTDEEWAAVRHRAPVNKLSWRKYNAPELRADPTTGVARLVAEPLTAPPSGSAGRPPVAQQADRPTGTRGRVLVDVS